MSPLVDVSSMVDDFDVGPLAVVRRTTATKNQYGEYVQGSPTTLTFSPVAVDTVTGEELSKLPEADRHRELICFYARREIQRNDVITYRGSNYVVFVVRDKELQGGVWMAIAHKEGT